MFKFLILSALLFFVGYGFFSFLGKHFGGNKNRRTTSNRSRTTQTESDDKRFSKDIGEYVSYEEVKDDPNKEK